MIGLGGTLRIEAACVSILGAITPGPLSAYLREALDGLCDDGFIQRFQVSVYPEPSPIWRGPSSENRGAAARFRNLRADSESRFCQFCRRVPSTIRSGNDDSAVRQ